MAFNLNDFRNKLVNGGARPSQFEMQIQWPDLLRGNAAVTGAERDFRFLCHVSQIPSESIKDIEVGYFGRKLKYAGDRSYEDITITVYNDEDFKVRKAFEVWTNAVTGRGTTVSSFNGGNASGSYATDGVVIQHSRNSGGSPVTGYKFIGMYPNKLGEIKLDWDADSQIESFDVTFAYQWWEPVDASTGATL